MSYVWLISAEYERRLREFDASGYTPTAEQRQSHMDLASRRSKAASDGDPGNYTVVGNSAIVNVHGILTAEPSFMAWLLDIPNTTYSEIKRAVALAEQDPEVKEIIYDVESGGGQLDGLIDALVAIDVGQKKAKVQSGFAASAAYWLASRAGKITAKHAHAEFGSIGVAISYLKFAEQFDIASTKAPKKRPDPSTEEGRRAIQEELDAVHDLFVEDIATARGVTPELVNSDFGQGGVLLADEAKKRGMIDAVKPRPKPARPIGGASASKSETTQAVAKIGGALTQGNKMDVATLQSQHPEVYAAVRKEAFAEGEKSGSESTLTKERDRIEGHLTLAESSGEMKFAHECILNGSELTSKVQAKHMAAAMNRRDISNREADDASVSEATGNAAPATGEPTEKDEEAKLVARMEELYGKDL